MFYRVLVFEFMGKEFGVEFFWGIVLKYKVFIIKKYLNNNVNEKMGWICNYLNKCWCKCNVRLLECGFLKKYIVNMLLNNFMCVFI